MMAGGLFKGIKYYLIGNVDEKVERLLNNGGGKRDHYLSEMITYVIADDSTEAEYSEAKELFELPVVTSRWVILSIRCDCLLPTNAFQPDVDQIFSGVTACPSKVSLKDNKVLWALVTANGGQYQLEFNNQVTHLITSNTAGSKYTTALRHPSKVHIVTPDWVVACAVHKEHLEPTVYHPRLLSDGIVTEDVGGEVEFPSTPPEGGALPGDDLQDTGKGGARTKEALARMVGRRIIDSWKAPELEPLPPAPPTAYLPSPIIPNAVPHIRGMAGPTRGLLRNITNSGMPLRGRGSRGPRSPRSPRGRSPRGTPRISQLVGMGVGGVPNMMSPGMMSPGAFLTGQQPFPFGSLPPVPTGPVYFGHDPSEPVPEDLCLMGCIFYITDYPKYLDVAMIHTWKMVIEQHGGEVDDTYTNRVTHVLCDHQQSDIFQLAKRDNKRLVTAYWLNDVLIQKKMSPPWHGIHIPNVYGQEKPLDKYVICVTNFEGEDRARLKHMILLMGAKYTGYMTRANTVLLCKRPEGAKYQKALEWQISIVNVQWLQDIILGDLTPLKLPIHPRYSSFTGNPFLLDLGKVSDLLDGWKMPVKVKDAWKKFSPSQILSQSSSKDSSQGLKRPADDTQESVSKRLRQDENSPPNLNGSSGPIILITGIAKNKAIELQQGIEKLGGHVSTVSKGCTHLAANNVSRTVKFLSSFSIVKHIVTTAWLEESIKQHTFVEETPFRLKDEKAESQYEFTLQESLKRADKEKLFQEVTFYMTPSVIPGKSTLKEIICNNGGILVDRQPSIRTIRSKNTDQTKPKFVVIGCDEDLSLCRDLTKRSIAVHNAEFILSGVMKQELDYEAYRIN